MRYRNERVLEEQRFIKLNHLKYLHGVGYTETKVLLTLAPAGPSEPGKPRPPGAPCGADETHLANTTTYLAQSLKHLKHELVCCNAVMLRQTEM